MPENQKLNSKAVERLLAEPSAHCRAETAQMLGRHFASGELSSAERAIAEDIFRSLVKDVEVRVRKALADSLKDDSSVSHEVAISLARDVDDVALPFVERSSVLTDDDLVDIIQNGNTKMQSAVAGRPEVSEHISETLIETGKESVVASLVKNDGASISDQSFETVMENFAASEKLHGPLVKRRNLPLKVAEKLVNLVSENLREHLVTHHELAPNTASDLILASRERATVSLLESGKAMPDVIELVNQLAENERLTPTIIMRALCLGDVNFFEAALARLAGIPVGNAYELVHDQGRTGLERLFVKCELAEELLPVARAALDVAKEMQETGSDNREIFRELMIERVLTQCDSDFAGDNLDYFITKIGNASKTAA